MTDKYSHIREALARATDGPWTLATSNSWRRIVGLRSEPVCEPCVQPDGHPDLHLPNGGAQGPDAALLIGARNILPELLAERDILEDVLLRAGFVRCDIPACNCGSWHHRYGLPERMQEIEDALAEAGHPLCNDNGNLVRNALAELVAERDRLQSELAEQCRLNSMGAERESALRAKNERLCRHVAHAANYIDTLGGNSKGWRAALAQENQDG